MHVWCKLLKILINLHWGHSDLTIVLERRSTVQIWTIKKIFNCLKSIYILLYCDKRNLGGGAGGGGGSDITYFDQSTIQKNEKNFAGFARVE